MVEKLDGSRLTRFHILFNVFAAIAVLVCGALCVPAHAGSYSVSYSGGVYTSPSGSVAYSGSYGASGQVGAGYSPVTCNFSGTITATFTWQPTNTADLPPPSAIVSQASSVVGTVTNGTITGNNGLSNAVTTITKQNGSISVHSISTLYTVGAGGATFTVQCSPTMTASVGMFGGFNGGISYSARAYPVTITPGGATLGPDGKYDILVGQGCTPSLNINGASGTVSGWRWSVTGTTFQTWSATTPAVGGNPANPNASYYVDGPGTLTNSTAHWYWNDPNFNTETVGCSATFTPPASQGSAFTVQASQIVNVYLPNVQVTATPGVMSVQPNGTDYWLRAVGGPGATLQHEHGMSWDAHDTTAAPFSPGTLEMVQVITPNRTLTSSGGVVLHCTENGQTGLDFQYPYGGITASPDYNTGDSPGMDLNGWVAATMNDAFTDTLMYEPPGSSQFVPLQTATWSESSNVSISIMQTWANYTGSAGSVIGGNFSPSNTFPSWTLINPQPTQFTQ